jgi:2'-5' RNA ligase
MRLFVAIALPDPARAALGELIDRLGLVHEPVKWVEERNLHLTVRFLGEVEEAKLDAVKGALDRAVRGIAAFDASLKGVGGYPSAKHPRVVWAGLEAPPALATLASQVEREVEALGFEKEERPFSAHVTLGRTREGHQRRRPRKGRAPAEGVTRLLSDVIEQERAFAGPTVRVEKVTLFQSKLGKEGPTYASVHEAALGG